MVQPLLSGQVPIQAITFRQAPTCQKVKSAGRWCHIPVLRHCDTTPEWRPRYACVRAGFCAGPILCPRPDDPRGVRSVPRQSALRNHAPFEITPPRDQATLRTACYASSGAQGKRTARKARRIGCDLDVERQRTLIQLTSEISKSHAAASFNSNADVKHF